ncbi:MAG: YunC family protein [Thermoplasmata archaeon]
MIIEQIKLKNKTALGIKLELDHAPLLIIKAEKGYLMCGYLNLGVSSKLGDVAARVTGVKNFEDMLNAKISEFSEPAQKMGFKDGITGLDFLNGLD